MSSVPSQNPHKALLVTGAPRSGTTWVGEMLALSAVFSYLYEPFNPDTRVWEGSSVSRFARHFVYVTCDDSAYYEKAFTELFGRCGWTRPAKGTGAWLKRLTSRLVPLGPRVEANASVPKPPLVKDPIALVSAEWLARHFHMDVVALVRHPAGFVASMRRLGWGFDPRNWALSQPALLQDLLEPYRAELESLSARRGDMIEQASVMWKVLNHIVLTFQARNPEWIVLRHEDLSRDPVAGFEALYGRLDLPFGEKVRRTIEEYSSAANPILPGRRQGALRIDSRGNIKAWRTHLSAEEIERIRQYVEPLSSRFYSEEDWQEDAGAASERCA